MEKCTRSTSIRLTVFLILTFSFPLQHSIASEATKTIIGVDLGMSSENLETSKRLLVSILSQADTEEHYGLVIADELVRTVIDPVPANKLLATLSELPLKPSDTGNFSTLLERSLAMDDESTANNTRLWFISSGEIKLTENEQAKAKQERFQMWASTILLPDIAARYEGVRMITPEQNNQEMVDTVIGYFGESSHRMLPTEQTNVAQLVDSLTSDVLPVTAINIGADSEEAISTETTVAKIIDEPAETEPVAVATIDTNTSNTSTVEPVAVESSSTSAEKIEIVLLTVQANIEQDQTDIVTNSQAINAELQNDTTPEITKENDTAQSLQQPPDSTSPVESIAGESTPNPTESIETPVLTVVQPVVEKMDQSNAVKDHQTITSELQNEIVPAIANDSDFAQLAQQQPASVIGEQVPASTLQATDQIEPDKAIAVTDNPAEVIAQSSEPIDIQLNSKDEQPQPAMNATPTEITSIDSNTNEIISESDVALSEMKTAQIENGVATIRTEQTDESSSIQTANTAESNSTAINPEVTDTKAAESGIISNTSIIVLAILAGITAFVIALTSIFRRRHHQSIPRNDSVNIGRQSTSDYSTALDRNNNSATYPPVAETNITPPSNTPSTRSSTTTPPPKSEEVQPESIDTIVVAQTPLTPETTNAVTEAAPTDATVVNTIDHNQGTNFPTNNLVDDFSAFDRSIIEKRTLKKTGKKPEPSDEN